MMNQSLFKEWSKFFLVFTVFYKKRKQFCTEEWSNISQSRCAKFVETYPNRLTAVIAVKGVSTKYQLAGGGHLSNQDILVLYF